MATNQTEFQDGIFSCDAGIDSGKSPLLLKRNQLSFGINLTNRGGFISNRPSFRKIALDFASDTVLQERFEKALWQGGGYYKPDAGVESLMAQIAGRTFNVIPSPTTATATVVDVSITGDLDSTTALQAWLWQSERWVIINDGEHLPIFFDGTSSRRSLGAAQVLAITAAPFTVPAIGDTVDVTVTVPYTGQYNIPVTIDYGAGAKRYIIVPSVTGTANATLFTFYDTRVTIPVGEEVIAFPSRVGILKGGMPAMAAGANFTVPIGIPADGAEVGPFLGYGTTFTIGADTYTYNSYSSGADFQSYTISVTALAASSAHSAGEIVTKQSPDANVSFGVLTAPFTVPPAFDSAGAGAQLSQPYTGSPLTAVWIGNGHYRIQQVPPPPSSTTLTLQNVDDVPTTVVANPKNIVSIPELPAGRMGAYGMGRNWESLIDGRSYIGSDLVGGSSGSVIYNYRDAVLKVTENTFLAGGGVFVVPGNTGDIRAMAFAATLDTSLGQGPLQVFTPNIVFSCNAPVDRAVWQALDNPLQTESLRGGGGLGQNSTVSVNGDLMFRSIDGIRSLILARREFNTWGNVPQSREVQRIIDRDALALLGFSSAIVFDNRLLMTAKPTQAGQGVYHRGLISLNFDTLSNIGTKSPSCYEGLWTGLNVLQLITGQFSGNPRAFAFCLNTSLAKIELYEILTKPQANFDNNGDGDSRITWQFETSALFDDIKGHTLFDLIRLFDGEISMDNIVGEVHIEAFWRPDFWPCWIEWHDWDICGVPRDIDNPADNNVKPIYYMRMGFGEPSSKPCEAINNLPMREFNTCQLKLVITGSGQVKGIKVKASASQESKYAKPICDSKPCVTLDCVNVDDYDVYNLVDNFNPAAPPNIFNNPVYYAYSCPEGEVLEINVTLPSWITYDEETLRFIGASGTFSSTTQLAATAIAQGALNTYIDAQIALGNIVCEEPIVISWAEVNRGFDVNAIGTNGSLIIVAGTSGGMSSSSDGDTFADISSNTAGTIRCIACDGTIFVAAGASRTGSPTGVTWTQQSASITTANAATHGGGLFVYVDNSGNAIRSADGTTGWTSAATGLATSLFGLAYGGGLYVCGGTGGVLATSPDAITWTPRTSGIVAKISGIAFGNSKYVAVGDGGAVIYSSDGTTWATATIATVVNIEGVAFGAGTFMLVDSVGKLFTSTDAITWVQVDTLSPNSNSIAYYTDGKFRIGNFQPI